MALYCTKAFSWSVESGYDCSQFDTDENILTSTYNRLYAACYVPDNGKIYAAGGNYGDTTVQLYVFGINPLSLDDQITISWPVGEDAAPIGRCYYCTINQMVYVRDSFNNIFVIDPSTNTIVDTITIQIFIHNHYDSSGFCERTGKLYACHYIPGSGNVVLRIDPSTNTIELQSTPIYGDSYGFTELVYVPDTDVIYALVTTSPAYDTPRYSKLIAFDPDTLVVLGEIDTGFYVATGSYYSRAVYVPSVNRIYVVTEGAYNIRVFTVTGGASGIGEYEETIDVGNLEFRAIAYDSSCDQVIVSESEWSTAYATLTIDPHTKAVVDSHDDGTGGYAVDVLRVPPSGSDSRFYIVQENRKRIIGFKHPLK